MGSQNVRRILLATPPLDVPHPRAMVLLLTLAIASHDEHGQYWGGVSWLCLRMGYEDNATGRRTVLRQLRHLQDRGYLKPTSERRGRAGQRVYQLILPELLPPAH